MPGETLGWLQTHRHASSWLAASILEKLHVRARVALSCFNSLLVKLYRGGIMTTSGLCDRQAGHFVVAPSGSIGLEVDRAWDPMAKSLRFK
jgi:hypothetical protein